MFRSYIAHITSKWRLYGLEALYYPSFLIQILIETKSWTRTFCPLPEVRKRREVFRNDT